MKKKVVILVVVSILVFSIVIYFLLNLEYPSTTCGDQTPFGQCSSTKPYYCLDGILINKASICDCPTGLTKEGDKCISQYQTNPKEITLNYILRGEEDTIDFTVYEGTKDYVSDIPRSISTNGEELSRKDFKLKAINDPIQRYSILPLVAQIQNLAFDKIDQARIAISLVQNIPYGSSSKTTKVFGQEIPYSRYPYEVLYDTRGICGEKTELLAFLLKEIGYDVAFLYHSQENHESLGIKCPVEYSLDNSSYCFIETTGPSIITDDEIIYVRGVVIKSDPEIIQVSEGLSLPLGIYEYKDAENWKKIRTKLEEEGGLYFYEVIRKNKLENKYGLVSVYEA